VYIRDLKSQYGTFVNGVKIARPSLLQSGDIIVCFTISLTVGITHQSFQTLGVEVSRTGLTSSSLTDDQLKPIVAKVTFSGL